MPPKKQGRRAAKTADAAPVSLSTASVFRDIDVDNQATLNRLNKQQPANEISKDDPAEQPVEEEEDDIKDAIFILKVVYTVQDFLNANMTFLGFAQILSMLYVLEILYVGREQFPMLEDIAPTVGFNILGVGIGLVASYMKSKDENKQYPEFEYIYAAYIPFVLLVNKLNSPFFLTNICLNYYFIDKLNVFFSFISSVMFFQIYNLSEEFETAYFLQISVVHLTILSGLNIIINGRLKKAETQLITLLIVNVLYNDVLFDNLPVLILQKLLISLIVMFLLIYPLFDVLPSYVIIPAFSAGFYLLNIYQLQNVLNQNAITWLFDYIFSDGENLRIVLTWAIILGVSIPAVFLASSNWSINLRRKVWHLVFLSILLYTPEILVEKTELTLISLFGAAVIFLLVEVLRFNQYTPVGRFLYKKLSPFQDEKDQEINLSYIHLIIGVTIPIVYDYINDKVSITRYIGIITLGVGDSLALIIGQKFGTIKWRGGHKSLQGSIAFVISSFASFYILDVFLAKYSATYIAVENWENLLVATLLAAVLEGSCTLNDNYVVPIILCAGYEILNKSFLGRG